MSAFRNPYALANENWFGINALKRKVSSVKNRFFGSASEAPALAPALAPAPTPAPTPAPAPDDLLRSMAASIASPAYLVLGAHPSERREYQSDEHYYTLNKIGEPAPRFILTDLSIQVETDTLAEIFKHKFDIVLFDCSVLNFVLQGPHSLLLLIRKIKQIVKPGGTLFIDTNFNKTIAIPPGHSINEIEEIKRNLKESYMNYIRRSKIPFHIQTVREVMTENEVVRRVYGIPLTEGCFRPENELMVMPIPHATGGKRKSRRRQSKRKQTRRRRH